MKKINPIIKWWVTPKLPYNDIFELPLLINKSILVKYKHIFSQWVIHPIKRRLAKRYLAFLQKYTTIVVIGITGSAGKTTTKEMLFSILKRQDKTVCTKTYLDPVYNIPNTILSTPIGTKYLILEMGVEYPGEMDFYLWLAKPQMGIITNIFSTHTQFLGDIDGVFKEKSKLVTGLSEEGFAVLNLGDSKLKSLDGKLKAKTFWFKGDFNPLMENANAASVASEVFGVPKKVIKEGLVDYRKSDHRLNLIKHRSGAFILDDTYNSNPGAALSALGYFNNLSKGEKVAVLGDMLELGDVDESSHRELGRAVSKGNFKVVVGIGKSSKFMIDEINKYSKDTKTYHFNNAKEAVSLVKTLLNKNTYLFIKGSRSIGLDKLIEKIL